MAVGTTTRTSAATSKIATKTREKLSKKKTAIKKDRQSRMEIFQTISDRTGLKRVEVEAVFTEFKELTESHLRKRGSGEIIVPKLGLKIVRKRRRATQSRRMISPLTGSEVVIPAKPARDDVKLIALKTLKEMVI